MIKDILNDAESRMRGAVSVLHDDLAGIRTGRASPALVERLQVEYYGTPTPLQQLASIGVPEPRSLIIKPFDASTLKTIEKAILISDLGLTPNNDGKAIHLNLPPLTEERRRDLVKEAKAEGEDGRVGIPSARQEANHELKRLKDISEDIVKDAEGDVQKLTDKYIARVEDILHKKEAEIMQV